MSPIRPYQLLFCLLACAEAINQAPARPVNASEIEDLFLKSAAHASISSSESAVQTSLDGSQDEDDQDCFFLEGLPRNLEDAYLDTLYGGDGQGNASVPMSGGRVGDTNMDVEGESDDTTVPVISVSPISLNTTSSTSPDLSNSTGPLHEAQSAGDSSDEQQSQMPAERTHPNQGKKRSSTLNGISIAAALLVLSPTLKRKRRDTSSEKQDGNDEQPRRRPRSPASSLSVETAWHDASTYRISDLQKAVRRAREYQSNPHTREELFAEVKSVYSRLTTTETTCIELSRKLKSNGAHAVSHQQWQTLIAVHRGLLREHHEFLLVSQHPSATPALRNLASKYAMPVRMWRYGIYSFLDILRSRLPGSRVHLLIFLRLAHQMVNILYLTIPVMQDIWMECLGDLGRYRCAIEDDRGEHEIWTWNSICWYIRALHRAPTTGRLYHHLAILVRRNPIRALYYLTKSVCVPVPFRPSGKTLESLLMFKREEDQLFRNPLGSFLRHLNAHDNFGTNKTWVDNAVYFAIITCNSLLGYEERSSPHSGSREDQPSQPSEDDTEDSLAFQHQTNLAYTAARCIDEKAFLSPRDLSSLAYLHVRLVFMLHMWERQSAADHLQACFPWALVATYLNYLHESSPSARETQGGIFPRDEDSDCPLPEDWAMRGLVWADDYFPDGWFAVDGADFAETAGSHSYRVLRFERKERLLYLGHRLAKPGAPLLFDGETGSFWVDQEAVIQPQISTSGTHTFPAAALEASKPSSPRWEDSESSSSERPVSSDSAEGYAVSTNSSSTSPSSTEPNISASTAAWNIAPRVMTTVEDIVQQSTGTDAPECSIPANDEAIACVAGRFILPKPSQLQSHSSLTSAETFRKDETSEETSEPSPSVACEGLQETTNSPVEDSSSPHSPGTIFRCPHCPRTYHRRCDLNKHVVAHTKPVKCTISGCRQSCSTPRDLERHQHAKHADQFGRGRKISCDVPGCHRCFARKDHVARHKRNAHGK